MKILIPFCFLLSFFTLAAYGQTKNVPLYYDNQFITRSVDSLFKKGIKEVIVFQTTKPFQYIKSADSILNFICWQKADLCFVQILSEHVIYFPIDFNGRPIFSYKDKVKTLVTNKEQSPLMLIPPVTNGNALFYFTPALKGYFEQPDDNSPDTYKPQLDKQQSRTDWYNLIYTILTKENFNFKVLPNYNRYDETK